MFLTLRAHCDTVSQNATRPSSLKQPRTQAHSLFFPSHKATTNRQNQSLKQTRSLLKFLYFKSVTHKKSYSENANCSALIQQKKKIQMNDTTKIFYIVVHIQEVKNIFGRFWQFSLSSIAIGNVSNYPLMLKRTLHMPYRNVLLKQSSFFPKQTMKSTNWRLASSFYQSSWTWREKTSSNRNSPSRDEYLSKSTG